MDGSTGQPRSSEQYQYSHRGRAIKSCLECRRRKMRCSRSQPCQNCSRFSRSCVYLPYPDWPSTSSPEVQRPSASRPSGIRKDLTHTPNSPASQIRSGQRATLTPTASDNGIDRQLELDELRDANGDDDILAQGLQIGKLRITQHIAGLSRPAVSRKIVSVLSREYEINSPYKPQPAPGVFGDPLPYYPQLHFDYYASWHDSTLEPPSGLLLSASQSPPGWGNFFPSREEIHILYHQYYAAVDPLAHLVHKPSFDTECFNLSSSLPSLESAPASFRALLLAICMAAAVSLSPMQSHLQLGTAKQNELVGKLKLATEKALIEANYMKSVKLQTLQAFTIYMIPQCRAEISRSHTVLIGALIRLAECADLHRETKGAAISSVERQVRRSLWHQICFLDVRTAEAQGHQPIIRDGEFNTPLPSNVDDTALAALNDLPSFSERWTDATFTLIRYECNLVYRSIFKKRVQIDNQKIDLKSVRRWVDKRKAYIEEKYLNHLDESIPLQHCAKVVGRLLTAKFNAMLLRRHLWEDNVTAPQHELQDTLVQSSLIVCESAVKLDASPYLAPWSWYAGAFQRYHTSVFLLIEIYRNPQMQRADRVEAVLDHVFGAPTVSSRERNHEILRILATKLDEHLLHNLDSVKPTLQGPTITMENGPAPEFTMVDPHQRIDEWQQQMYYNQHYMQEMTPTTNDEWWDYQNQYAVAEHPVSNNTWIEDFGMNSMMGILGGKVFRIISTIIWTLAVFTPTLRKRSITSTPTMQPPSLQGLPST
ncbi:hypothetical protein N7G274_010531 [Stereocaulon virgatum]|uniref:Zn(2)-C6 fungal-type domain-containing protein n=1 Tax=Stereocaulon virgatum TaxID=373712 RepID=A0ABR3ZVI6_9LECA